MSMMPLLVIGHDPAWRARMERILGMRARTGLDRCLCAVAAAPGSPRRGRSAAAGWRRCQPSSGPPGGRCCLRRGACISTGSRMSTRCCIASRRKAHACLDKQAPPATVMRAILAAESGMFVTSPSLLLEALRRRQRRAMPEPARQPPGDWSALTERQREIVHWAAQRHEQQADRAADWGSARKRSRPTCTTCYEREGVHGRMALLARAPARRMSHAPESRLRRRHVPQFPAIAREQAQAMLEHAAGERRRPRSGRCAGRAVRR